MGVHAGSMASIWCRCPILLALTEWINFSAKCPAMDFSFGAVSGMWFPSSKQALSTGAVDSLGVEVGFFLGTHA